MNLSAIDLGAPRRLAHLPLIMDVMRRSRVVDIIDAACGVDKRQKVSHGECVAFIIAGVFAGEHGLWRLKDRLDVYDMATIMQDAGIQLEEYHDVRLGRACDAIFAAGPDKIHTALALHAIEAWELQRNYLHVDTTTLSFYGAYETNPDEAWRPEVHGVEDVTSMTSAEPLRDYDQVGALSINGDGRESPQVVHGYAKNKRHDLKQVLYGSVVTRDGGVPLYARVMDGNTSDISAAVEFLDHLRGSMTSEPDSCLVVDSKGWNGTVLHQVHRHRLRLLSRLPRGTKLAASCLEAFAPEQAPCLLRRYSTKRAGWDWVAYEGMDATYTFTVSQTEKPETAEESSAGDPTASSIQVVLPVRAVVCFSSALFRHKIKTLAKIYEREKKACPKKVRGIERRSYACADDAQAAAEELHAKQPFITHTCTATVVTTERPGKKPRGRPRADQPPPPPQTRYQLRVTVTTPDTTTTEERLRREATYILIRNRLTGWDLSDHDMVVAYGQQWRVEHGFAWLKSSAHLNPTFLESPRRIEAIGLIYHIALMIHTLIQRAIRSGLKAGGWTLPYHRNKPSQNITARFLYEIFRHVTTQTLSNGTQTEKRLFGDTGDVHTAIKALGLNNNAYKPVLHAREK